MRRITFDLDVLRTLVAGVELGSFAKAADRLGRSTSAVSAQLKKLEDQAGSPVLRKAGRGMVLTPAGEVLLGYARRLLDLNDEAAHAVRGAELKGEVRLGVQEDFGESLLPTVLGGFARAHPNVRVQARLARNAELIEQVERGQLDLALAWDGGRATAHTRRVARLPMQWIGRAGQAPTGLAADEPVPLAVLEAPCLMRSTAIAALDKARRPWRIAFTSPSLAGIWAAVDAGLGVTVRTRAGLPERLAALPGLPRLPAVALQLHRSDADPSGPVQRLESLLQAHLKTSLNMLRTA
ncbi:LysR substrate-binding domain-containing protein [Roseateles sp. BYS78W]|uniref:LysR substrate-binding domain-containing protein n=1 Tax=Pelomonas candidula TaxID=3299025 RepID=A0ABW7HFE3_9BURK